VTGASRRASAPGRSLERAPGPVRLKRAFNYERAWARAVPPRPRLRAPGRMAAQQRSSPLQPAFAVREVFVAGVLGELGRRPRQAHPAGTASAISETSFSLLAGEARTAQQMRGDEEAEAEYDIRINCYLYGKRLRAGSRRSVCEQTPECRREHRRPPAR
jgi:hypothetical protein